MGTGCLSRWSFFYFVLLTNPFLYNVPTSSTTTLQSLTDSHCREIGDYDALVIVQLAGFAEGELLLYERLQMTPMLLERYAKDGSEKARRQMLAICQTDPEVLADVLGHFVELASERLSVPEFRLSTLYRTPPAIHQTAS